MTKTLLSIGHGFSAQTLARQLLPRGWRVIGTTRDAAKCDALAATGVEPVVWPGSDLTPHLQSATHLLSSAPPSGGRDPVIAALGPDLARHAGRLAWAGYLSTTGVYGHAGGAWVDENSPPDPATDRGRARVVAEGEWQRLAQATGLALHIFRLAGIYGPGRGPLAKVRAGTARLIVKRGQVFSRIHVEDIAQVLAASIARPDPGAIYNVCDDEPVAPEVVLAHAAAILGVTLPPAEAFETAAMTPMARSFYAESKRVSNARIKRELGVTLLYPTYREGLAAQATVEAAEGAEAAPATRTESAARG